MSTDFTRQVAEFIAEMDYAGLSPLAVSAAKDVVLDAIGVALAGSREEDAEIVAALAREDGGEPVSTVIGHGFRTSAAQAALVNGVAVHALDFDSSFVMMGQPMAGLVPAVLALAEPCEASGAQVLSAYATGYEVAARIARCMPDNVEELGWHSTATLGSFGCAAAAANLLGLNTVQTQTALGIVSSMASGLVSNFGTMSKPLHAGLAARNGVQAARLAQRGFSGNLSALEPAGGFFDAFAHGSSLDLSPLTQMGRPFEVERGVRFKPYPCGGLTHSAIDAILELRSEHRLTAEQIDRIDVSVTRHTAHRIVFQTPETGIQGKFCLPYIIARAVIDGALMPDSFTDNAVRDPEILTLASRVKMTSDPSLDGAVPGGRPAVVAVTLMNGQTLERRVDFARGGIQRPLSHTDLREKFTLCARRVLNESSAQRLLQNLDDLEHVDHVSNVTELIQGPRDGG
ncbi:MAG: MmgE/PrpD family protein [Chloroflexota bacterium]